MFSPPLALRGPAPPNRRAAHNTLVVRIQHVVRDIQLLFVLFFRVDDNYLRVYTKLRLIRQQRAGLCLLNWSPSL